jgi:hypothetical protein
MVCLFANPLVSRLTPPCLISFPRFHDGAVHRTSRIRAPSRTRRSAPRRQLSCREVATPRTAAFSCGVAHLSSCAMPRCDRGRRAEPMKRFDPKSINGAGHPGFTSFASSRLWLSEASLRALVGASRVDSYAKPSRSLTTIQAIFCGAEMWISYGKRLITRARGIPERSCRAGPAARPAAVNSSVTTSRCPAPSSTTRAPCGDNSRPMSRAIAR